jgi:hypothetical protein
MCIGLGGYLSVGVYGLKTRYSARWATALHTYKRETFRFGSDQDVHTRYRDVFITHKLGSFHKGDYSVAF